MNDIISLSAKKRSSHEFEKNVGPFNDIRENYKSSGIQIGAYSKLLDDTKKQMKDGNPSSKLPDVGRQNSIKDEPNYLKWLQQSEVKTSSKHIKNDVLLHRHLHDLSGMTEMNPLVKREIHGPYSRLMNQNTGAGAYFQLLNEKKKSPLQFPESDLKTPNAGGDTLTEQDPSIKVFKEEKGSPSHLSKSSSNTAQTGDDIPV